CNRNNPARRIAVHITEGIQLFHVDVLHPGELIQDSCRSVIGPFIFTYEATHRRPLPFFRFKSSLDQERLELCTIKTEYDTIDRRKNFVVAIVTIYFHIYITILYHQITFPLHTTKRRIYTATTNIHKRRSKYF